MIADRHPGGVDVTVERLEQGPDPFPRLRDVAHVPTREEVDDGRELRIEGIGHGPILAAKWFPPSTSGRGPGRSSGDLEDGWRS